MEVLLWKNMSTKVKKKVEAKNTSRKCFGNKKWFQWIWKKSLQMNSLEICKQKTKSTFLLPTFSGVKNQFCSFVLNHVGHPADFHASLVTGRLTIKSLNSRPKAWKNNVVRTFKMRKSQGMVRWYEAGILPQQHGFDSRPDKTTKKLSIIT